MLPNTKSTHFISFTSILSYLRSTVAFKLYNFLKQHMHTLHIYVAAYRLKAQGSEGHAGLLRKFYQGVRRSIPGPLSRPKTRRETEQFPTRNYFQKHVFGTTTTVVTIILPPRKYQLVAALPSSF